MNTTNKAFKIQIREHILDSLMNESDINNGYAIETTPETLIPTQLRIVADEFHNWYGAYEQKRNPNFQAAFTDWMDGLPSCLNTEFEYHTVHNTMKEWYENAGAEYKPKEPNSSQEYQLYKNLVYRELRGLFKSYNVNLY